MENTSLILHGLGDFVINAEKIGVTGNKETEKIYFSHTGILAGQKVSLASVRKSSPEKIL